MQLNRILALTLVFLCLIAAILAGSKPDEMRPSATSHRAGVIEGVNFERIAVFNLQGAISGTSDSFLGETLTSLQDQLEEAAQDDSVKAVLIKINSPGGTVGTSQELYRAVEAIRAAGKPVVATMQDIAASGGYYVASAADKIYANPGTLTGSIGVIVQGLNVSELLKEVGIQAETYKTGQFKDILSFYRSSTDAERQLLQDLIENTLDQFITDVAKGRQALPKTPKGSESILTPEMTQLREKMTVDQVRKLADGRIMTGAQAVKVGLVDALGGDKEAIADLRLLVGDLKEELVVGNGSLDLLRQLFLKAPSLLQQLNRQPLIPSQILRSTPESVAPLTLMQAAGGPSPSLLWLAPNLITQ